MNRTILLGTMILCCATGPSHANFIFLDDFDDDGPDPLITATFDPEETATDLLP